jgi:hypothetical protein
MTDAERQQVALNIATRLATGMAVAGVKVGPVRPEPPDGAAVVYVVPGDVPRREPFCVTVRPQTNPSDGYRVSWRGADGRVTVRGKSRLLPANPRSLPIVGREIGLDLIRAAEVRRRLAVEAAERRDLRAVAETLTASAPPGVVVELDPAGQFRLVASGLDLPRVTAALAALQPIISPPVA